ncbi:hypothetical protein B0H21DRAFT_744176 [Amylocystis lapponica]|nr:hypothetical protein B0H21DRAFT_744176 [Amylocystis lapponica]
MSNERLDRTVYIETGRSQSDIRNTFSQCGKIYGIYPWASQAGHTGFKYFVEFCDRSSIKRARALPLPDIKIHVAALSPQLIAQFSTIVPPPSVPSSPAEVKTEAREHERVPSHIARRQTADPRPVKRNADWRPRARPSTQGSHDPLPPWTAWQRPSSSVESIDVDFASNSLYRNQSDDAVPEQPNPDKENGARLVPVSDQVSHVPIPKQVHRTEVGLSDPSPSTIPIPVPTTPVHHHPPESNAALPQELAYPEHPADTSSSSACIILTYCGTRVTCNLDKLDESADGIIEVLKATAAQFLERDKWMIVGGHYRSKGNVRAAAAVMSAMIEVMTSHAVGLPARDLKPAFLMLSSCHTDLAKQTRAPDGSCTDESTRHILEAAKWLQHVYGTHVPPAAEPTSAECAATKASMDVSAVPSASTSTPAPPRGCLANTSNLPAPATHERRESSGPSRGLVQMLEREIQALRDRQADHTALLSEARALRRRAQEDLDEERRARRKAERAMEQAGLDVVGVRRAEKLALEEARAEGEGRRRAELRAEELRDELVRVRRECQVRVDACAEEDRRARECFGKLGALFLKASKGEMEGGVWKDAFGRERGVSAGGSVHDMHE